jgi:hypothetical protein
MPSTTLPGTYVLFTCTLNGKYIVLPIPVKANIPFFLSYNLQTDPLGIYNFVTDWGVSFVVGTSCNQTTIASDSANNMSVPITAFGVPPSYDYSPSNSVATLADFTTFYNNYNTYSTNNGYGALGTPPPTST